MSFWLAGCFVDTADRLVGRISALVFDNAKHGWMDVRRSSGLNRSLCSLGHCWGDWTRNYYRNAGKNSDFVERRSRTRSI